MNIVTQNTKPIFDLPETDNLDLDYLRMRLTLKALNHVRKAMKGNKRVKEDTAKLMGISTKTLWRFIRSYQIKYHYDKMVYYVLTTEPFSKTTEEQYG